LTDRLDSMTVDQLAALLVAKKAVYLVETMVALLAALLVY